MLVNPIQKVCEAYYYNVMLSKQFLPAMCQTSGKFIFQQAVPGCTINFLAHSFGRC